MIEFLITFELDGSGKYQAYIIASSIPSALKLSYKYIEKEWPGAKSYEVISCEFIRRIHADLIEQDVPLEF